jgi:Uma2 family endonuclease
VNKLLSNVMDEIAHHRFTSDEYYQLVELGFFEGSRVELIQGEIIAMPPMGSLHATTLTLALQALQRIFAAEYVVRSQMPLHLDNDSEPEPDIAVVTGKPSDYAASHPSTALLAVEITVTTLTYDRDVKGPLYARAGIPDYWLIDVPGHRVTIFRHPRPDASSAAGWTYGALGLYLPGDQITPLEKPDSRIAVSDLFYNI